MKKTILKITATITFFLLMGFNITTSLNHTNFSLTGLKAFAYGSGGSGGLACTYISHNGWMGQLTGCRTITESYTSTGKITIDGQVIQLGSGGSYTHTTSERVCSYETYDPYNVGYTQEIRKYNSAMVERC